MRRGILFGIIFLLISLFFPVSASDAPFLQSPSSGSTTTDTSPTLSWSWTSICTSSGSCFRVQVDDQSDFSSPNKDYYTSNTSYSPQLGIGTWYWRVKAKDASNNWSEWSSVWNFSISQDSSPTSTPNATPTSVPTSTQTPPTQTSGTVELSEFMPNPEDGKEWVEVHNPSGQATDISEYKIDDIEGGSSPFTIPGGTIVNPGSYFVFYFDSQRFNNDGDSVRLLDPSGQVKESYSYQDSQKGISFAKDSGGNWSETQTQTPGSANQISKPQGENASTTTTNSKKTSSTMPKETPKSDSKGPTTSKTTPGAKITGQVLSLTEATLPAVLNATTSPDSLEAPSEAIVKSSKTNFLGAIFLILAGTIILGSLSFRLWKRRK
ncbi:hypothetical protein A2Z23_02810 [Candidatus Curtissbacteria bacterium RBG_16_39_7]|uniref:LTD domain-containing protein n=1 Tax=Candidatus Curtissbacteria bacterium RBG_16_39_7 TaxID=1797707 RepID=A0A1F5G4G9_9BACT|nr:MAG: hypothetical protein A2Z23_02810 [Candidatus Curtissbacteria bacterium RBG_16_39_7]